MRKKLLFATFFGVNYYGRKIRDLEKVRRVLEETSLPDFPNGEVIRVPVFPSYHQALSYV